MWYAEVDCSRLNADAKGLILKLKIKNHANHAQHTRVKEIHTCFELIRKGQIHGQDDTIVLSLLINK